MWQMRHKHDQLCNTLFLVLVSPQSFMRSDAKVLQGMHKFYIYYCENTLGI